MGKLIDYYDESVWGELGTSRSTLDRERLCVKLIMRFKPNPKNILDVGCGNGEFLEYYASQIEGKVKLFGLDYSEYQAKIANAKEGLSVKVANVEEDQLPHKPASMDIVYAAELVEHLYDPDSFFAEAHRVLKDDGILVVSTPNLHAWYNRILFFFGIMPIFYEMSAKSPLIGAGPLRFIKKGTAPVGRIRLLNKNGLEDLLKSQGFEPLVFRASIFESLPKPVQFIDKIFTFLPTLSSNLIVVACKKQES